MRLVGIAPGRRFARHRKMPRLEIPGREPGGGKTRFPQGVRRRREPLTEVYRCLRSFADLCRRLWERAILSAADRPDGLPPITAHCASGQRGGRARAIHRSLEKNANVELTNA